jgi:hypothetical protein
VTSGAGAGREQHGKKDMTIKVAWIGVLAAAIPAVIVAFATILTEPGPQAPISKVPAIPPARSPYHSSGPTSCGKNILIQSPANNNLISHGGEGFTITGYACDMKDRSGWLLDLDLKNNYYYLNSAGSPPRPAFTGDGPFTFVDPSIGNDGDSDRRYGIVAVVASASCSKALESVAPDRAGNYEIPRLPRGCQAEDPSYVLVSRP